MATWTSEFTHIQYKFKPTESLSRGQRLISGRAGTGSQTSWSAGHSPATSLPCVPEQTVWNPTSLWPQVSPPSVSLPIIFFVPIFKHRKSRWQRRDNLIDSPGPRRTWVFCNREKRALNYCIGKKSFMINFNIKQESRTAYREEERSAFQTLGNELSHLVWEAVTS